MKTKKGLIFVEVLIILGIVVSFAAIIIPSSLKARETARAKSIQEKDIPLFAKVISVAESSSGSGSDGTSMAAVLQVEEKPDYVLAVADYKHIQKIARAKAILQSAIASGGIVEILAELTGHYNEGGEFVISHIKVNKLEVELK